MKNRFLKIIKRILISILILFVVVFISNEIVYRTSIPENCVQIKSDEYNAIDKIVAEFATKFDYSLLPEKRNDWMYQEWSRFISQLPKDMPVEEMAKLDEKYNFKNWGNAEIMSRYTQHISLWIQYCGIGILPKLA